MFALRRTVRRVSAQLVDISPVSLNYSAALRGDQPQSSCPGAGWQVTWRVWPEAVGTLTAPLRWAAGEGRPPVVCGRSLSSFP